MGRYRTDSKEKALKGTLRKSRELKAPTTSTTFDQAPEPPKDLPAYAQEVWRITAKELQEQKILTVVDLPLFKSYCFCLHMMKEAQEYLEKEGLVITQVNTKGQQYQAKSPYVSILNDATSQANRLGAAFGLNPLSRQKLNIKQKPDPNNPFAELDNYMNAWEEM
ncbi:phage terminase small subunit P27 family [Pontibacter sp. HSC-36F09]|uniref:phage terminase small subunit P27 family n=1 Tax=Pontibacter sp. HSC-36F09 TaxID=2910966 RepID=UPI00209D944D|nr:phage terminase small subunit P27 family [Pontibacter sp. HSC-36F09]MCP2043491.1 P27 family predicted phage terminase small subunit [Pontibacter sp. HSC-36F09]